MIERYLSFWNHATDERVDRIDVTGKSEREIEKTLLGMLRIASQRGYDWGVLDSAWSDPPDPPPKVYGHPKPTRGKR
jgi:hypothetical protein